MGTIWQWTCKGEYRDNSGDLEGGSLHAALQTTERLGNPQAAEKGRRLGMERILRLLRRQSDAPLVKGLLLLTALLFLPSLRIGFLSDDLMWLPLLRDAAHIPATVAPYFVDLTDPLANEYWTRRGFDVWWSAGTFEWKLLRPLANALLVLQWRIFGTEPLGYHAVSWLFYIGLVGLAAKFYRRVVPGRVALLAATLFALQFSHMQTEWLICNQHSLFSAAFGLIGLMAHLKWREQRWGAGLPVSLCCFGLGLGFGESLLGMLAFVLTFELVGRSESLWLRVRALLPVSALALAYVALHHGLGYTSRGSLLYLDPAANPGAFLGSSLERLPALLGGLLGVLPADFWILRPRMRSLQAGLSLLSVGIFSALLLQVRTGLDRLSRRRALWLGCGALLALLPGLASPPGGRLLLIPTLGSCVLLAWLIQRCFQILWPSDSDADSSQHSNGSRWVQRLGVLPLVGLHLCVLPLLAVQTLSYLHTLTGVQDALLSQPELEDPSVVDAHLILLNMPGIAFNIGYLSALELREEGRLPGGWSVLNAEPVGSRIQRVTDRELEMTATSGHFFAEGFSTLLAPPGGTFSEGQTFRHRDYEATVLELREGRPVKVSFTFSDSLDNPRHRLLKWEGTRLERLPMLRVGQGVDLPVLPSLLGE